MRIIVSHSKQGLQAGAWLPLAFTRFDPLGNRQGGWRRKLPSNELDISVFVRRTDHERFSNPHDNTAALAHTKRSNPCQPYRTKVLLPTATTSQYSVRPSLRDNNCWSLAHVVKAV